MKTNYQTKIIGLIFLAGGICYLGEQCGFWDFTIFFPGWWTIFIILPAFFSMVDSGIHGGNVILLLFGVYLLLAANDWITFRLTFGAVVSLLCILVGFKMIFGTRFKHHGRHEEVNKTSNIHSSVCFGSRRHRVVGLVNSVDAQCMFGSQFIDLSEADVHNMEFLYLNCMFGSIDLIVPNDMNYVVKKDNMFGACYIQDTPLGKYDIYVDVSCVFGQVNLRKKRKENVKEGSFKEK